jgi:hypothetical protein
MIWAMEASYIQWRPTRGYDHFSMSFGSCALCLSKKCTLTFTVPITLQSVPRLDAPAAAGQHHDNLAAMLLTSSSQVQPRNQTRARHT